MVGKRHFLPKQPVGNAWLMLGVFCLVVMVLPIAGRISDGQAVAQDDHPATQPDESKPTRFQQEYGKIFGAGRTVKVSASQYLRTLVTGDTQDEDFLQQIQLLGSPNYQERQDAEAFLFTVPLLPEKYREEISRNPDMEVRYRLKSIFEHRKDRVQGLTLAALETVVEQKTEIADGLIDDLFDLLDVVDSNATRRAVFETIRELADPRHQSTLVARLDADDPDIRWLAAQLLEQFDPSETVVELLTPLLQDDVDWVRLETAKLLIDRNHKPAVKTLIDLVDGESLSAAARAVQVLNAVTGEDFGHISFSNPDGNQELVQSWLRWETEGLQDVQLNLPLKDFLKVASWLNGHTLIAKDQKLVIELDEDKQEIFRMTVPGVLSAEKTADGNYLLFSYSGQWLKEYSPDKKIVWEISGLKFNNAMPLGNGNVLVTIGSNSLVREIDPRTKKTVWEYKTEWWPNDAFRLDNGNTLIGGKGGVIEVTPEQKVVWEHENGIGSTIVVAKPTENNGILIGWTNGQAREIDRSGETLWEYRTDQLSDVFRAPNGNTLVAAANEIIELNPDGEVVWKMAKQPRTASVRQ